MFSKEELPEEIKERLARATGEFIIKTGVEFDDVQEFLMDIIGIMGDYMVMNIPENKE